jgi:hypothetical protein
MIHHRRTVQIAPGRQAEAIALAHEYVAIHKKATGVDVRVSVVTTGTLGRLCFSADYESMGAYEADRAKAEAHPDWIALGAKGNQRMRDGTNRVLPGSIHDEFWRDA